MHQTHNSISLQGKRFNPLGIFHRSCPAWEQHPGSMPAGKEQTPWAAEVKPPTGHKGKVLSSLSKMGFERKKIKTRRHWHKNKALLNNSGNHYHRCLQAHLLLITSAPSSTWAQHKHQELSTTATQLDHSWQTLRTSSARHSHLLENLIRTGGRHTQGLGRLTLYSSAQHNQHNSFSRQHLIFNNIGEPGLKL